MNNKQELTWAQILEYASGSIILYKKHHIGPPWYTERSRMIQTYNGTLTVVFNGSEGWKQCSVKVGDSKNYSKFTQKLVTLLNEVTDKKFTLEDLIIR